MKIIQLIECDNNCGNQVSSALFTIVFFARSCFLFTFSPYVFQVRNLKPFLAQEYWKPVKRTQSSEVLFIMMTEKKTSIWFPKKRLLPMRAYCKIPKNVGVRIRKQELVGYQSGPDTWVGWGVNLAVLPLFKQPKLVQIGLFRVFNLPDSRRTSPIYLTF